MTRRSNYNIPRKIRELQYNVNNNSCLQYYNIPRKIRELQYISYFRLAISHYNIPRKIRELQCDYGIFEPSLIITYQGK